MKGYVYMLRCSDGSYYVGSTTNLSARIAAHEAGEGWRLHFQTPPTRRSLQRGVRDAA
ncbi:MAG TPA: GIY-YIG nuclease family protein [Dehalococcoidia bacterium]|nr:GIY-YIG nuclease family protein [Dehalococcoidia bacterium]